MFESFFDLTSAKVILIGIKYAFVTLPVWLPLILLIAFYELWIRYTRLTYILKRGGVLLELKLPKEVTKSPLAMEVVFISLYLTGTSDFIRTHWKGKVRPWFSLELVSIEGQVRFFIWLQPKYRRLLESQIYAQYPGVEIYEAEDYTKSVHHNPEKTFMWGTHFKLTKADVYPIKTYVDYGIERESVEEEYKVDPMTSVLEFLGSIKKDEQVWIQILVQAHRKENAKNDARILNKPDWTDKGKKEIEQLIEKIRGERNHNAEERIGIPRVPTKGEAETIAALERGLSKFPFEVAIRAFYISKIEAFDPVGVTGLIGSFRQYSSNELNGFKLGKFTDFDYPWEDWRRMRRSAREKKYLNAYKMRSYFQPPYRYYKAKPFILNTEELATIFHLPGKVATTPTIPKAVSKKGEAPANLPI